MNSSTDFRVLSGQSSSYSSLSAFIGRFSGEWREAGLGGPGEPTPGSNQKLPSPSHREVEPEETSYTVDKPAESERQWIAPEYLER